MKRVVLVLSSTLFATGMTGNCNGNLGMPGFLDGDWRAAGSLGIACLTIFNDKIIQIDDGCNGDSNPISSPEPIIITGNRIIMTAVVGLAGGGSTLLTLDVELQSDGSLAGTQTLFLGAGTSPATSTVVMNRQ